MFSETSYGQGSQISMFPQARTVLGDTGFASSCRTTALRSPTFLSQIPSRGRFPW